MVIFWLYFTAADTIKVTFRCIGFHEITRKLIEPANDMTLNVKMLPSISDLQEVTVTDFRKQITSMQKPEPIESDPPISEPATEPSNASGWR